MATEGPQTMSWLFFSPSGRIGRLPYFLGWLFWIVGGCFFCARILAVQDNDISLALWTMALVVAGLISTVSIVMLTIKRLHDVGYPRHVCHLPVHPGAQPRDVRRAVPVARPSR